MFERFTESARVAVSHAQNEAREMGHLEVSTDHLLIGLMREEVGLAARVLDDLDVSLEHVRSLTRKRHGARAEAGRFVGQIPFSRNAQTALQLALREALSFGHNYIGTEHLLMGLMRDLSWSSAQAINLTEEGRDSLRNHVIKMLSSRTPEKPAAVIGTPTTTAWLGVGAAWVAREAAIYKRGWNDGYEAGLRESGRG